MKKYINYVNVKISYFAKIIENSCTRLISSESLGSIVKVTWKFPSPTCPTITLQISWSQLEDDTSFIYVSIPL